MQAAWAAAEQAAKRRRQAAGVAVRLGQAAVRQAAVRQARARMSALEMTRARAHWAVRAVANLAAPPRGALVPKRWRPTQQVHQLKLRRC